MRSIRSPGNNSLPLKVTAHFSVVFYLRRAVGAAKSIITTGLLVDPFKISLKL
jgi:hypothetical protein